MSKQGITLAFKKIHIYMDETKSIYQLNSGLLCLKAMMLTLKSMSETGNKEYRELSMNLQNNLFYEDAYLRIFHSLCRQKAESQLLFNIHIIN